MSELQTNKKDLRKNDLEFFIAVLYPYIPSAELPDYICGEVMGLEGNEALKACKRAVKEVIDEEYATERLE